MSVVDDRAYWIDNSQMYGTLQQLCGSFVKLESTDKLASQLKSLLASQLKNVRQAAHS